MGTLSKNIVLTNLKIFQNKKSCLVGINWYISGSIKSNRESVGVSACVIIVIAVDDKAVDKVVVDGFLVVDIVVVDIVEDVVVDDVVVNVAVADSVVLDNSVTSVAVLDWITDRCSAAAAVVVVGLVVVVTSCEQNVFSTDFHLQIFSSNNEKKSLKYLVHISIIGCRCTCIYCNRKRILSCHNLQYIQCWVQFHHHSVHK